MRDGRSNQRTPGVAGPPEPGDAPPSLAHRTHAIRRNHRMIGGVSVNVCVVCGFGIPAILEVAHLDHNRKNNAIDNLAALCPNCHRMHDVGLIPSEVVIEMRERVWALNWEMRMQDAGAKAAETQRAEALRLDRSAAAKKAWATRARTATKEPVDGS